MIIRFCAFVMCIQICFFFCFHDFGFFLGGGGAFWCMMHLIISLWINCTWNSCKKNKISALNMNEGNVCTHVFKYDRMDDIFVQFYF